MLRAGFLTGAAGEALLTPPGSRLRFNKLFLFGIGAVGTSEETVLARVSEALRRLAQAGAADAALQLPSRVSAEQGIRALLDEPGAPARALVFGPDPSRLVQALSQVGSGTPAPERRVAKVPTPATPLPPVKSMRPGSRPAASTQIPRASPLPFAPPADATRLPGAPAQGPGSTAKPTVSPSPTATQTPQSSSPPRTPGAADRPTLRPAPPPPQRYVPPPPKPKKD